MHLEPAAQTDARLSIVAGLFERYGLDLPLPTSVAGSPDGDENYRHVVKMACGRSDWGRPRLGAYERDSHKVLPIPNCRVATSALRRAMGTVTHHILESGMPPYEEKEDKGTTLPLTVIWLVLGAIYFTIRMGFVQFKMVGFGFCVYHRG